MLRTLTINRGFTVKISKKERYIRINPIMSPCDISVAIVGSGAIGGYYGARLWESNYNVTFVARGEHFKACKEKGLDVKSIDGNIFIPPSKLQISDSTEQIGPVDWIVIATKSTSLPDIPALISPLLKQDSSTRVLAIMNGYIDEDLLSLIHDYETKKVKKSTVIGNVDNMENNKLPFAAIYGGMAFTCSNVLSPGKIHHSFGGLVSAGVSASSSLSSLSSSQIKNTLKYETNQTKSSHDLDILQNLWKPTKVEFVSESSLISARWVKNIYNLPFNGISVAMGGITVDKICSDPKMRQQANRIMDEVIAIAYADIKSKGEDPTTRDWDAIKTKMWYLSDNMGAYKTSTMLDLQRRKPMEVKYLFRKPLDRAHQLKIPVPTLEQIVIQVEKLQKLYNLY